VKARIHGLAPKVIRETGTETLQSATDCIRLNQPLLCPTTRQVKAPTKLAEHAAVLAALGGVRRREDTTVMALLREGPATWSNAGNGAGTDRALRALVWRMAPRMPARFKTPAQVSRFKRAQPEFDQSLDLQLATPQAIQNRNSLVSPARPSALIDFRPRPCRHCLLTSSLPAVGLAKSGRVRPRFCAILATKDPVLLVGGRRSISGRSTIGSNCRSGPFVSRDPDVLGDRETLSPSENWPVRNPSIFHCAHPATEVGRRDRQEHEWFANADRKSCAMFMVPAMKNCANRYTLALGEKTGTSAGAGPIALLQVKIANIVDLKQNGRRTLAM